MTKQELFELYYDEIKEKLIACSEDAMRSSGKVRYVIYAGEEDGVQVLEDVSGGDAVLDNPGLVPITTIDYGASFNPAEYLPYDTDIDSEDEEDNYEYWQAEYAPVIDDDLIGRIMAITDWNLKMDEILDNMYYER